MNERMPCDRFIHCLVLCREHKSAGNMGPLGKFCGLTENAKHVKKQHKNYAVLQATVEALKLL